MRGSVCFLVVLGLISATARASAQQKIPDQQFPANHFSPAIGPGNYVQVDGALVAGNMTPSLEGLLDFSYKPFTLYTADCKDGKDCTLGKSDKNIVKYQFTTNLGGTLTMWNRVQWGLLLPLVYTTGESYRASTPDGGIIDLRGGSAFALGDPRLSAKIRLVGQGSQGFMLAVQLYLSAPLGNAIAKGHNVGYETVTGGGHLAAEYRLGKIRFGANLGGEIAPDRTTLSTTSGSQMTYGVAAGYEITSLLSAVGEVVGGTRFTTNLAENPAEWRVAGKLTQGDFVISLGGGTGIVSGVGIPIFRVIGGVAYQPAGVDEDGDGVGDNADACPGEAEDKDGYLDDDGCPDADNDGDGVLDAADKCPDQPEDPDGFEDQDGCPDTDNDKDGIQDGYDSCPDKAEDKDGDRDEDGCPDNDRDRDGVEDDKDKCPDQPEDTDGFGDEDGCPELDYDGDGLNDDQDQCPDQMEDKDGFEDDDGCPEDGGPATETKKPAPAKPAPAKPR